MLKRPLGNTGFEITPVAYGGVVSMKEGQKASDLYVSWAIDNGINYFDIAPSYGDAQSKLGNSLRQYRRNIYLACKTKCRLRKDAEAEFNESFKLLNTDYFDIYQLHELSTMEDVELAFNKGGVMEMMVKAKQDGLTRKLGITAHSESVALKAMSLYEFDTVLFPINWGLHMEWGFGESLIKDAKVRGMGLLAMKSFIERAWLDELEHDASSFPKSWCKPIDPSDEAFGIAVMKYALSLGVDTLVPPGNFASLCFAIKHIDHCFAYPIDENDRTLLSKKLDSIRLNPFLDCDLQKD